ncbi:MAG: diadenylate cyclase [Planctomycetia bacterium]|jgi:DNA integrity scanning protein DisA with diadenylate cyclase activity
MKTLRLTDQFKSLFQAAFDLALTVEADAVLLLVEGETDWLNLAKLAGDEIHFLVAADEAEYLLGIEESGLDHVLLDMPESPVFEQLTQALLEATADDLLSPSATVVAIYSGFEAGTIDSISVISLSEHLNRLTGRELRNLETSVPLDTLKIVVDLAVDIGRDGREGHAVGTMFVVGDSKKVLAHSRPVGFDPVKGYKREDRNLDDARVREGIREIAGLDGAIIVSPNNIVEATCRYLDAPVGNLTLSKGLGARHWAAAAISQSTKAIAVTVSQSNGTVRIFQNGEVVLRIEPTHRRPVVWKDFE